MNGQQLTQRIVLGVFAVTLALPGLGAKASVEDGGFYDKAQFEGTCEDFGGIFTDTRDGNTWCQWDDDSQTVCDDEGQDCHDIPRTTLPTGPWASPLRIDGELTTDVGGPESSAAEANISTTPRTQQNLTASDDDQDQDLLPNQKAKNGKKGKKGGKGRRK